MNVDKQRILLDIGCDILTTMEDIGKKTYMELGTRDNYNYDKIKAKHKMGVDINGRAPFHGTTDEYFEQFPDDRFDIVFIDACHDHEFVVRDFNNSIRITNEWIILHDMIPPSARYTDRMNCSDSYRILYYIMTQTDFEVYPMNENMGLTLVKMPATEIVLNDESLKLTYEKYAKFLSDKKLYNRSEITEILNGV